MIANRYSPLPRYVIDYPLIAHYAYLIFVSLHLITLVTMEVGARQAKLFCKFSHYQAKTSLLLSEYPGAGKDIFLTMLRQDMVCTTG